MINDITDEQDIISKVFSHEEIQEAQQGLKDLLKTTNQIGNIKIVSDEDGETLKATVETITSAGQRSTEVFKLQNRAIGDVIDGVQQYEKVWKKTTETVEENFTQQERQYKQDLKYITQLVEAQKDLTTKYSTGKYIGVNGAELRKQSKELEHQLEVIQEQVISNKKFTEEEKRQTQVIIDQTRQLKRESMFVGDKNPSSLFDSLVDRVKWNGAYDMINGAETALRYTIDTLKEVEFSVMEITRVLNDSTLDTQKFTTELFDLATEYGRSFSDATEVTLRFAQAGYNASDSMEMAKTTMLALNTAELNVEESTNSLIGILKQWNLETEDFALVVDKINYAADNYAVTSQDLVDGLLRSSSAARLAKLSFDETIGALIAMRETSGRTGKEVGTALNSLISYTQRVRTLDVFEQLGVKVYADESKETLMPLLDVWSQLSQKVKEGGDNIVTALERHTDLSNLMSKEVAAATGTLEEYNLAVEEENELRKQGLTDMEKQSVYEQAGTHRRNYFIALLENFNRIQEVATDLQNAEGHSMAENAKYMDTLTARYHEFITALQALANEAGSNGLMGLAKDLLSIATALVKAAKSGATMPTLISAITFSMTALNKEIKLFNGKSIGAWKDFSNAIKAGKISVTDFIAKLKNMSAEAAIAELKTIGLRLSVSALNAAISFGTTILIQYAIKGISYIINYSDKMAEKFEEVTNKAKDLNETFRGNVATINSVKEEYAKLAQGVDEYGNNLSLTDEEYKRFKELSNQISDIAPDLVRGFDSENNSILNLKGSVDSIVSTLDDYIKTMKDANNLEILNGADSAFKSFTATVSDLESNLDKLKQQQVSKRQTFVDIGTDSGLYEYINLLDQAGIKYKTFSEQMESGETKVVVTLDWDEESISNYNKQFQKEIDVLETQIQQQASKMRPIVQAAVELDVRYDQLEKNTQNFFDSILENQRFASNEEMQLFIDTWLGKLYDNQEIVDSAIAELFSAKEAFKTGEKDAQQYTEIVSNVLNRIGYVIPQNAFDPIQESWLSVINAMENGINLIADDRTLQSFVDSLSEEYAEAVKNISSSIDSLQNAYSTLSSVVTEYNTNGAVSLDTLQNLINLNPQYVALLTTENGQLQLNEQAFKDLAIAEIEAARAKQLNFALETISKLQSETEALQFLRANTLMAADATNQLNAQIAQQITQMLADGTITQQTANELLNYADAINKVFDSARTNIELNPPPSSEGGGGGGKSWYDSQVEAFERLNRMGQKNSQDVVNFYRNMTKASQISVADRLKAEEKLFDAIKKQIQESLKLQLDALNKQKKR